MTDSDAGSWDVIAVRYASRSAWRSKLYLNFDAYHEDDADVGMDYFFWVLRRGKHTVLFDTGFNATSGARHHRRHEIDPAEALARLGIEPTSITHVILSHLHYDHAGNLDLAPEATVILSRRELEFWSGPYADRPLFASAIDPEDLSAVMELRESGRLVLFEDKTEPAPGLQVVEVGGHTPGQSIVLVDGADQLVLLAADAIHYYEEQERQWPFLHLSDLPDVYRCFDTIDALTKRQGALLVPGHDPEVMRRFPPVPGLEHIAVRVTGSVG